MSFLTHLGIVAASNLIAWAIICGALYLVRPRPEPPPDLYREGDAICVQLVFILPRTATREDVGDWLGLMVAGRGSMARDNPLFDCEPEAALLRWGPAVARAPETFCPNPLDPRTFMFHTLLIETEKGA